jgi:hypothetical protein
MSIRTYLQFKVHQTSNQIADLKKFAAEEAAKQNPEGKNNHLSPKSSCWGAYKASKRDCSLYLTMLSIVKRSKDEIPTKALAVQLFHEHQLWNHARKGYAAKNFYFKAFRRLQKIGNRLTTLYAVEQPAFALWIIERKAKLEAKHAAAAAN